MPRRAVRDDKEAVQAQVAQIEPGTGTGVHAALVRGGVARLLTENGVDVVAQTGNGDDLLACVRDLCPDVALVDVRMPPTYADEGLRAAREIRSDYPGTAVLVLSQHLEPEYALRLVEERPERAGYLLKERVGRVEQLLDAVQRVAAGECVVDRAVVDDLLARRRQVDPLEESRRASGRSSP